jgi:hypothetical protein
MLSHAVKTIKVSWWQTAVQCENMKSTEKLDKNKKEKNHEILMAFLWYNHKDFSIRFLGFAENIF